jgi:AraC-like DNA-binding protein/CheY-like chemotaxis protein
MTLKMNDKSIVVVAKEHSNNFYSALPSDERSVSVVPFKQSIDAIHKKNADIVLLDCGHDGENGLEWLTEFKNLRKDAPVIFITNVKSHDIVMNAYKLGVRDYFTKPVSISELYRIITELLSLKRSTNEKRRSLPCKPANGNCKMRNNMISDIPTELARAVHYIDENISNSLNLSDISRQANLSKYHFARSFKKMTGFSPLEFAGILKMHRAKKLLQDINFPVSLVAEEVGYDDLRNFDRRFKQYTGFTPSMYRKSFSDNLQ